MLQSLDFYIEYFVDLYDVKLSGGRSEAFRFRRKSASETFEKASGIGTRSPRAPYDL